MTLSWLRHLRSVIVSSVVFVFVLSTLIADAKTQYVSDELVITLRQGKGNEYKIIKMLRVGTPLEILEEADQYLRVRTEEGLEGWVLKQYITPDPPKTAIIAGIEKERDRLKSLLSQCSRGKDSLQNELKTAKSVFADNIEELNQSLSASERETVQRAKELKTITDRYNTLVEQSRNVVQLANERDQQKELMKKLNTEAQSLRKENSRLKRLQILWWFLAGGGVFFAGWITGKVSRRKKYYSY